MSDIFSLLTIPCLLAMFLAINMGGSGTAPSFSAAYGANVLKKSVIPGLFGISVLAGALIAGQNVSLTLGKGLLSQEFFNPKNTSIILFSVGFSILIANLIGVPQSTSQGTALSIGGAALALDGLNTEKLFYEIIPTWIILPLVSFSIMLLISKWLIPKLRGAFVSTDFAHLSQHKILKGVLIFSSIYVAFSIGSNNVANAAAPIASLTANQLGYASLEKVVPIIVISVLLVAPCFAIGSSLLGHKVTEANGKEIIEVGPFYATVISFLVASLLLSASLVKGIPTSLVQLNGAAFIALSISKKGFTTTFKNKTVKKFFIVWAITPVFAFVLTYVLITILN